MFLSFWYDVVPLTFATVVLIVNIVLDRMKAKKN